MCVAVGVVVGAVSLIPRRGGEASESVWRENLAYGGPRDRTVFFLMPGLAGTFFFLGLSILATAFNLNLLLLALPFLAMMAFAVGTFAWGVFHLPYPLALTPSWFRPIKAEQIRRDKRKRLRQKSQAH